MNIDNEKFFKKVACSGSFLLPNMFHNYDNIYKGLGIDIVKCQHCYSEFARSETSANCKNCGAPVGDWTL